MKVFPGRLKEGSMFYLHLFQTTEVRHSGCDWEYLKKIINSTPQNKILFWEKYEPSKSGRLGWNPNSTTHLKWEKYHQPSQDCEKFITYSYTCTYTGTQVYRPTCIFFLGIILLFYKGRAISNLNATIIPTSGTISLHNRCIVNNVLVYWCPVQFFKTDSYWEFRGQRDLLGLRNKVNKSEQKVQEEKHQNMRPVSAMSNFSQEETLCPSFPLCL